MRARQSLTQVNWLVAVPQKKRRLSRIGCAVIGKAHMHKNEHKDTRSVFHPPPSGDGMLCDSSVLSLGSTP